MDRPFRIPETIKQYAWLLWMLAGVLGFQVVFPSARIASIEIAQAKESAERVRGDSLTLGQVLVVGESLREHLAWANQRNELLVGLLKLKCLEGWNSSLQRSLLQAAGIPCADLLANQVPAK